jgi:hypothetical protein
MGLREINKGLRRANAKRIYGTVGHLVATHRADCDRVSNVLSPKVIEKLPPSDTGMASGARPELRRAFGKHLDHVKLSDDASDGQGRVNDNYSYRLRKGSSSILISLLTIQD